MARLTAALFPGEYGPGYSGGPITLHIMGVLMDGRFDDLDAPSNFAAATV
jgi:hypothetical protein